ncbi:MAG: hypothetical protein OHK0022_28680 [Roseiflexaceae bacterium]
MGSIFENRYFHQKERYIDPKSDFANQGLDITELDIGDTCLVVFSAHIYDVALKMIDCKENKIHWPYKTTDLKCYTTKSGKTFSVHFPAYGSPRIANSLEILAALGVKKVYGLGLGGTPQKHLHIGDIVLVEGSVRGDGASRYYAPIEYPAISDLEMITKIRNVLLQNNVPHNTGLSFSTDAFYQETKELAQLLRQLHVLIIDMESSAFLTIGRRLGLRCSWSGVVSDRLVHESLEGTAHSENVTTELVALAQYILRIIQQGE